MRKAGLDPNANQPDVEPNEEIGEKIEVDSVKNRKRLPSGSPDAKKPGSCSGDSYNDAVDIIEDESNKANWRQYLQEPHIHHRPELWL